MFCGIALARRGHDVVVVDRDAGPPPDGGWDRRGVMQFHHPHFFRHIVRRALQDAMPDVWDALLAAGGIPAVQAGLPEEMTGLQCRRSTFERAVWTVAAREPGLSLRTGHADRLVTKAGRVTGVIVDGHTIDADMVICATGRGGRFATDLRPPGEGGACGFSYVSRMYRARLGVEAPDVGGPMGSLYAGYLAIVFPQDDRTLSTLVVRATSDGGLAQLRDTACFDAVAPLIPQLTSWVDPDRFEAITPVLAGGGLTNTYRGQLDEHDRVPMPGLYFVGDAVCTTNPAAGRGLSLGLRQAHALIGMLGEDASDHREVARRFDTWCTANIRPWYDDHVYWDESLLRRFAGEDLDISARIPSDVICAAADADPTIRPAVGPYLGMTALPSVLAAVEDRARTALRAGWRPPYADGPSRDELVEAVLEPSR